MTAIHDRASHGTKPQTRKEFFNHLIAYGVVNAGICAWDVMNGTDKLWFYWVAVGWGVGLAVHAYKVFGHRADPSART